MEKPDDESNEVSELYSESISDMENASSSTKMAEIGQSKKKRSADKGMFSSFVRKNIAFEKMINSILLKVNLVI